MFSSITFFSVAFLCLILLVSGKIPCDQNRPTWTNLQNAICCFRQREFEINSPLGNNDQENIDHLVTLISSKFLNGNWLVDVVNFRGVELANSGHPIILRRPLPVFEKE